MMFHRGMVVRHKVEIKNKKTNIRLFQVCQSQQFSPYILSILSFEGLKRKQDRYKSRRCFHKRAGLNDVPFHMGYNGNGQATGENTTIT